MKNEESYNMNKKVKKIIAAIMIIIVIAMVITIMLRFRNRKSTENIRTVEEQIIPKEEFVDKLEDGTRINSSDKLHETKTFDGLEISDFQLTEKDNMTVLLGKITNNANTKKGGYAVNITVLDKDRNEMTTAVAYIKELQPGESTTLNVSSTFDYANAYDFIISRK